MRNRGIGLLWWALAWPVCSAFAAPVDERPVAEQEVHLRNIRQLTSGGENAEAYFSADGKSLTFQSTRDSFACDQIYTMTDSGALVTLVSTSLGRNTCSYWAPDGKAIIYASTFLAGTGCPPPPDHSQGYVWAVYGAYDIFRARPDGTDPVPLTQSPGYDAEAVYSHDGRSILFTSARDGDLELYTMRSDGQNVVRLTNHVGYDGGAFYSAGDSLICWRAGHIEDSAGKAEFQALLARDLVRPTLLELFVMRADGTDQRQLTHLGGANFCPFFMPDGKGLIFSSNHHSETGREFDLFTVDLASGKVEQITFAAEFDGFPMFSPDGKRLVWCSNRNGKVRGETNVFMADWVP
jgi:TolB protein